MFRALGSSGFIRVLGFRGLEIWGLNSDVYSLSLSLPPFPSLSLLEAV